MNVLTRRVCLGLVASVAWAQTPHNLEAGAAGLIPLSGWKSDGYAAGPGWHAGYELRPFGPLGMEAGFAQAWPHGTVCSRFGCEHPRERLQLFDSGLRAHLRLNDGRVDLSIGAGGGYIWYKNPYQNDVLFQYSGKVAVALGPHSRYRLTFGLRAWRDLGRPTQQWLTSTAGIEAGLGRLR